MNSRKQKLLRFNIVTLHLRKKYVAPYCYENCSLLCGISLEPNYSNTCHNRAIAKIICTW